MSDASDAFYASCGDIDRLLEIHADVGGDGPGKRYGVQVLNKSGLVLLSAFWEAFCEDLAAEAIQKIVDDAEDASVLPKELRKVIAKELRSDLDESSPWKLADDGWKAVLLNRMSGLKAVRDRALNTPNSDNIDKLFFEAMGIVDLSHSWYWPNMRYVDARKKLDSYLKLRHEIAHRGGPTGRSVWKSDVQGFYNHLDHLVYCTDWRVNKELSLVLV